MQRIWSEGSTTHIDVRGLPPPEPFTAIMELVRGGAAAIVVHHDRNPLPLYEALAAIGWEHELLPAEPGEFRIRLRPVTAAPDGPAR